MVSISRSPGLVSSQQIKIQKQWRKSTNSCNSTRTSAWSCTIRWRREICFFSNIRTKHRCPKMFHSRGRILCNSCSLYRFLCITRSQIWCLSTKHLWPTRPGMQVPLTGSFQTSLAEALNLMTLLVWIARVTNDTIWVATHRHPLNSLCLQMEEFLVL